MVLARSAPERVRAVLFDVDGTLTDSAPLHHAAWVQSLEGLDVDVPTWDDYDRHCLRAQRKFEELVDPRVLKELRPDLFAWKTRAFQEIAAREMVPLPGVLELHGQLHEAGVKVGLVSTGRRASIQAIVAATGLPEPHTIVGRDDVTAVKPSPEPYLLAMERLEVAATEAVIFEDAPPGIAAACGAGVFTVAVPSDVFGLDEQERADAHLPCLSAIRLESAGESVKLGGFTLF